MKQKIITLLALLMPFLVFAQDNGRKTAYFFYLDTCPHCHNVDDYFNANGIYDKYDIIKLDASISQNGEFLMKLYEVSGYPEEQRGGVPVVAFGDKFFVGDKSIIDNFVKEIEASQNADQLPNPYRDGKMPKIVAHEGPISQIPTESARNTPVLESSNNAENKSKKNYFPVVVGILVILGAGILIFVNRKG